MQPVILSCHITLPEWFLENTSVTMYVITVYSHVLLCSVAHVKDKQISTVTTCFIYGYCYFMISLIHAYNKLI